MFLSYIHAVQQQKIQNIADASSLPRSLEIDRDGDISIFYAPFDYVNPNAKLVLVGITPGLTQMRNALHEAKLQLQQGADQTSALIAAKRTGAFSGPMRPNLVAMLDHIKVNKWLGIRSCESLFQNDSSLVHTTSALRYPVFVRGENYNGTPNMTKHPLLRKYLTDYLAEEIRTLGDAIVVPLGPKVSEALEYLVHIGAIDGTRVLEGFPHPSGANAERIAYFLGRKNKDVVSKKTDPVKIDNARAALEKKMSALLKSA